MFCGKCGNKINAGEKFCSKCGTAGLQEQVQPFASQSNVIPTSTPVSIPVAKKTMSKKTKTIIAATSVALVIIIITSVLLSNFVLPRVKMQKAIESRDVQQVQAVYDEYFDTVPYFSSTISSDIDKPSIKQKIINNELVSFYSEVDVSLKSVFVYVPNVETVSREEVNNYLRQNYGNLIIDEYGDFMTIYKGHEVYYEVENADYYVHSTYYEILSLGE